MAFQISPGVNVSEVDITTVVPSVLTTAGAFAGNFQWGPVNKLVQVDSEITLVNRFGKPDGNTANAFFTASSFLAYGNNLQVVRAANTNSYNADGNGTNPNVQIANRDVFEISYLNNLTNANTIGAFAARYPGALGNSLTISVIDAGASAQFASWNVNGVGVSSLFTSAPNTSTQCASAGGAYDEMHVVVMDTGGLFTGVKNTVLETFAFLSKGSNATDSLGNSNYYKNYIFNNSKYIYAVDPVSYATTSTTWGQGLNTTFATVATPSTVSLAGGTDQAITDADVQTAYGLFTNADSVDISLVLTGAASVTVQQYVIDNIANSRKDCVAFVSPRFADVVNQAGNETTNIQSWNTALARSTSYAVADSGWKYMFDKYNNIYRYVPMNGDIAGLCVYTDSVRDPWFSPAGYNRGNLKNVVKLAWNPNKTQRDTLYSLGINPVVTFPGNGTILYGDKTLQAKPSAFDRINVRRLFIVLEKTISIASKYSLFEFNDDFTRANFVALVTPFLRDIQGRRGITDFKVVCDTTNNTGQVIDSNQFVGDIYIKPARSINFIQLNFVAVRTGVDFTEVVGKF
jgi:phage tail sheath protein FI